MTTATDKHLQCWGSATYNRVETEREIPKLRLESINEAIKLNIYRGLLQESQYGS